MSICLAVEVKFLWFQASVKEFDMSICLAVEVKFHWFLPSFGEGV